MKDLSQQKIYYTLRVASAMCFIGHGSFGIITKQVWCNYFAVFDIGGKTAFTLMPMLGVLDIVMGLIILFYPLRVIVSWLVVWGMVTATLRPLSGEPVAEFLERAGNYGAPLSLLLISGGIGDKLKSWLVPVKLKGQLNNQSLSTLQSCLSIIVFLLFMGHGWLGLIDKKALLDQYARLGFSNVIEVSHLVGMLEISAAIAVVIKPSRSLLLSLFIWKVASELTYPHYEFFEWIERGGSYGCILALYFVVNEKILLYKRVGDNSYVVNEHDKVHPLKNYSLTRFNIN